MYAIIASSAYTLKWYKNAVFFTQKNLEANSSKILGVMGLDIRTEELQQIQPSQTVRQIGISRTYCLDVDWDSQQIKVEQILWYRPNCKLPS